MEVHICYSRDSNHQLHIKVHIMDITIVIIYLKITELILKHHKVENTNRNIKVWMLEQLGMHPNHWINMVWNRELSMGWIALLVGFSSFKKDLEDNNRVKSRERPKET